ncbi:hypothetical protein FM106_30870 [Brachybacterium faecium]|nr:hypothetical protein FM106_30870 [Brachybacterium faecium]
MVSSAVAHRSPLRGPAARSVPAPGGAGTARSCRSSALQCDLGHAGGPEVSTDRLPPERRPASSRPCSRRFPFRPRTPGEP